MYMTVVSVLCMCVCVFVCVYVCTQVYEKDKLFGPPVS